MAMAPDSQLELTASVRQRTEDRKDPVLGCFGLWRAAAAAPGGQTGQHDRCRAVAVRPVRVGAASRPEATPSSPEAMARRHARSCLGERSATASPADRPSGRRQRGDRRLPRRRHGQALASAWHCLLSADADAARWHRQARPAQNCRTRRPRMPPAARSRCASGASVAGRTRATRRWRTPSSACLRSSSSFPCSSA